ncbi:transcription factor TFIIF [Cryptosporidium bovis]|uniref:transcription factor TFIIF n=1 Tax=Cryptosporidium bovis TaxID=310047 RepID=UPI00351A1694|nr:transcription factor TFIIF [Cryptosporidium bovis]
MDSASKIKVNTGNSTTMSNIENRRRKNVTIRKPIILGTYAFMLSIAEQKKRGDNATHSWTCFLRSPDNEDISYYIKKVVFSLHPSFLNPNRVIEKCPFEVTECGWGEFDIIAKVYFVDSTEKPVEIKHFLRLYPPGTTDVRNVKFPTDNTPSECVVSETCDEFIFFEPTEKFYEKLINGPIQPLAEHRLQPYFQKVDKTIFEKTLSAAHASIQNEMAALRAEIAQITLEIQNIRENYYSLRPNEVASLFPHSVSEQSPPPSQQQYRHPSIHNKTNSPSHLSDPKDNLHNHNTTHIIDHGIMGVGMGGGGGGGITHKAETYSNSGGSDCVNVDINSDYNNNGKSPQGGRTNNHKMHNVNKNIRPDIIGDMQQYQMVNSDQSIHYHSRHPSSSHPTHISNQQQVDSGDIGAIHIGTQQMQMQQHSYHSHTNQTHPNTHLNSRPTSHPTQNSYLQQNYQQHYSQQGIQSTSPQMLNHISVNSHQNYNKYQTSNQIGPQIIDGNNSMSHIQQQIGGGRVQMNQNGDPSSLDHPVIGSDNQMHYHPSANNNRVRSDTLTKSENSLFH